MSDSEACGVSVSESSTFPTLVFVRDSEIGEGEVLKLPPLRPKVKVAFVPVTVPVTWPSVGERDLDRVRGPANRDKEKVIVLLVRVTRPVSETLSLFERVCDKKPTVADFVELITVEENERDDGKLRDPVLDSFSESVSVRTPCVTLAVPLLSEPLEDRSIEVSLLDVGVADSEKDFGFSDGDADEDAVGLCVPCDGDVDAVWDGEGVMVQDKKGWLSVSVRALVGEAKLSVSVAVAERRTRDDLSIRVSVFVSCRVRSDGLSVLARRLLLCVDENDVDIVGFGETESDELGDALGSSLGVRDADGDSDSAAVAADSD